MADIASITVFDGATTPVVHSFTGVAGMHAKALSQVMQADWTEFWSTLPEAAYSRLYMTESVNKRGQKTRVFGVLVPVMETATAANSQGYTAPAKVAHYERWELRNYSDPRSTASIRRVAMQMLLNAANNVSTSVTPVTNGPVAEFMQLGIMPS